MLKTKDSFRFSLFLLPLLPKWQFKIKGMSISTNAITSDLQAKLDKAREEIHSGQCITLKSHDDIDNYFASL